ncbi:MAG: phospho-N-acetylmuramoyl-pentapeptide-transferase [Candidatus Palauibacterales bacterium]|nr:phospho-N-acetylmuramoyl-pentapeptide-transferase [Candidatus Palauibacterales bacterium]
MLYHFLYPLADEHIIFNVFQYITFRSAGAMVTALLVAFVVGPSVIRWLEDRGWGQVVRLEGPKSHLEKAGTPTMGGIIILAATLIPTLLWARLDDRYVQIAMVVTAWMGAIGFVDDYLKVVRHKSRGLIAGQKLVGQMVLGVALGWFLLQFPLSGYPATHTTLPFFKNLHVVIWAPLFPVFVGLVLAGSSNAVNLTDGLDGLAAGLAAVAVLTFGVFAYVTGRVDTSAYLNIFYLPGAGELTVFCTALAGAAIGFLWFNAPPAEVFMGDTGSLALGGAIGAVAVLIKEEFLLLIVGGVFVAEAVSVLLQTGYYKVTKGGDGNGQRLFRMAPLHHHFEKIGWPETKVVIRFYILSIICALVGLATLKIR